VGPPVLQTRTATGISSVPTSGQSPSPVPSKMGEIRHALHIGTRIWRWRRRCSGMVKRTAGDAEPVKRLVCEFSDGGKLPLRRRVGCATPSPADKRCGRPGV
jgi:hypothetical protein